MSFKSTLAVMVAAGTLMLVQQASSQKVEKKLIQTGHDMPTPQQLRRDLAVMEKEPFDGLVITITAFGPDATEPRPMNKTFSDQPWKREWFEKSIGDLKAIEPTRFRHIFINTLANPGGVDWFDEAGWKQVVDHFRIAAWVARQGRLKGLLFDPEPYTRPYQQFMYSAQPQRTQHTFAEYQAKARQRGREVMSAVASEYPDITILTYFLLSYLLEDDTWMGPSAVGVNDPSPLLVGHPYSLMPAFLNGWLDVAPRTVKIIDGDENGYWHKPIDFWRHSAKIKTIALDLVAPENRVKYQTQVQPGFGIYLDAYLPDHPLKQFTYGMTLSDLMKLNIPTAVAAAEEYVWVYGEIGRWWPEPGGASETGRRSRKLWSELLPGCDDVLRGAKDPGKYRFEKVKAQVAELEKAGRLENLAVNGDFSGSASKDAGDGDWHSSGGPSAWSYWQDGSWMGPPSTGRFSLDWTEGYKSPGSAKAAGVTNGCFLQGFRVKTGEHYYFACKAKLSGEGAAGLGVVWKDSSGKVISDREKRHIPNGVYLVDTLRDSRGWSDIAYDCIVPDAASEMFVALTMYAQPGLKDAVWFDDVKIYRLP